MENYDFKNIESKWQEIWERENSFIVTSDPRKSNYYCLVMFPYPSGHIHMGHLRNYVIGDVLARYKRMCNYNVLHPIGWDGFGLPAENAAIQHQIHPAKWTRENINYMRQQLKRLGISYDWSREFATCDYEYYKWNQWFFIKFYERGLVYRAKSAVNWCPSCQTVLANEQISSTGECWRCKSIVEEKELEQWFFRIRAYAEELLEGLEKLKNHWPESVLLMQKNWIGKSEGALAEFRIQNSEFRIKVFTTRPDTLFGATFMVFAPEHEIIENLKLKIKNYTEVKKYIENCKQKSSNEITTEKTGIKLEGISVLNPVNNEKIPIWVADYVTAEYGTGAIMAVPAHDQRDFEFAKKYNLPIRQVIQPIVPRPSSLATAYEAEGIMVNSGEFSGLSSREGKEKIIAYLEKKGMGERKTEYRLKDWLISRQRYWGTPIPIVYCEHCGVVPVKEEDLPVVLPENVPFTGTGESPLAKIEEFVYTKCPQCAAKAKRETDTMDTFVDSSWYYVRYCDSENEELPFAPEKVKPWLPVHQYIGGIEHACMHLIYARFFHKVVRDLGLVVCSEPFANLLTQGMVTLGGIAMSKSRGNVVEPETVIEKYGVDTLRLFILFASPPEKDLEWSDRGIEGCWRFLNRVWRLVNQITTSHIPHPTSQLPINKELIRLTHLTIKRVTEDIEKRIQYNTAIAAIMELVNFLYQYPCLGDKTSLSTVKKLVLLLHPFVPHLANELWQKLDGKEIDYTPWPEYESKLLTGEEIEIGIEINGKLRTRMRIAVGISEEKVKQKIFADEKVKKYLQDKKINKFIYIPEKLVNLVTK